MKMLDGNVVVNCCVCLLLIINVHFDTSIKSFLCVPGSNLDSF